MNASTWSWRLLCAAGVVLGLCLAGPVRADEKGKKDSGKGKDAGKVIVIHLDVSKAPPGLVKQLVELSRSTGKDGKRDDDDDKPKGSKKSDDDKKKGSKKDDDDGKKGSDKRSNIVQVDLNKLSPDLARRLRAELAGGRDDDKKGAKKDDDDDDKKKTSAKKDDDDDKKKKKGDDDDDDDKKKKPGKK